MSSPGATPVGRRGLVVVGLLLSMSLAALDGTVVATAIPTIVGTLGGLSLFSWVFSVYLLASTVTVPLYGKLSDLHGRKPVLLFGCGLFVAGSVLCGLAQSMEQLVFFRAVQGLGAGSVQTMVITIIGDLFPIEQRARIQGITGSVWGIAGIAGPAVGALITDTIGWRFVFFVNLPLGLAAMLIVWHYFLEQTEKREHRLDLWGAALLSGSILSLLLALLQGVEAYGWTGSETLLLFGLSALLLGLFVGIEQRVAEPLIALSLFRNRVVAVASLATFASGALMFGVNSYVPLFAQGVYGGSAIDAGLLLGPMSVGWPLASVLAGKVIPRSGYYPPSLAGGTCLVAGSAMLLLLDRGTPQLLAMFAVFVIGAGMGFTSSALIISVQNAVPWAQRGIATALQQFARTMGGSISIAIMGAVLTRQLTDRLARIPGSPPGADADVILTEESRAGIAPDVLVQMQDALAAALHDTFVLVVVASLITFAIILFFPRGKAQELQAEAEAASAGAGRQGSAEPQHKREAGLAGSDAAGS